MHARRLQFNSRFRQEDLDQIEELANRLRISKSEALRRSVAKELARVRRQQKKALAGTEAA